MSNDFDIYQIQIIGVNGDEYDLRDLEEHEETKSMTAIGAAKSVLHEINWHNPELAKNMFDALCTKGLTCPQARTITMHQCERTREDGSTGYLDSVRTVE